MSSHSATSHHSDMPPQARNACKCCILYNKPLSTFHVVMTCAQMSCFLYSSLLLYTSLYVIAYDCKWFSRNVSKCYISHNKPLPSMPCHNDFSSDLTGFDFLHPFLLHISVHDCCWSEQFSRNVSKWYNSHNNSLSSIPGHNDLRSDVSLQASTSVTRHHS